MSENDEQCSNLVGGADQIHEQCSSLLPIDSVSTSKKPKKKCTTVAERDFDMDEIVWSMIRGHVPWPAQIVTLLPAGKFEVRWYNDYRKTKVFRTQIFKFLPNFPKFSENFDKKIGLRTAAQEAITLKLFWK